MTAAPTGERGLVLLGDRTASQAQAWCTALERAGFHVEFQPNAVRALQRARDAMPVAVVVQWGNRHDPWLALMRMQRDEGVPARFLALIPPGDGVAAEHCIAAGADAVADHDCSGSELAARIKALVRRQPHRAPAAVDRSIRVGDLVIDPAAHVVWRGPTRVRLSGREFAVLMALVRARGRAVSRDELYRDVWPADTSVVSRAVDVCIITLRRKLERDPRLPEYIRTVRSVGYMVASEP